MNREILFRGKRMDNGEWIEGDLLRAKYYLNDIEHYFLFTDAEAFPANEFCGYEEVDPSTVGQYTGLTDEDGAKVFEGDIVRISMPVYKWHTVEHISEVYFDNGCFCVNWGGNYRPHDRTRIDSFIPETTFEVIGNVHDNPELLEGGGEK